jgi:hypothetical protein
LERTLFEEEAEKQWRLKEHEAEQRKPDQQDLRRRCHAGSVRELREVLRLAHACSGSEALSPRVWFQSRCQSIQVARNVMGSDCLNTSLLLSEMQGEGEGAPNVMEVEA